MQTRAIPHYHKVIRLDNADSPTAMPIPPTVVIDTTTLAGLVIQAARTARLDTTAETGEANPFSASAIRFGTQIDVQPINASMDGTDRAGLARKIAGYLAKYVTKSVDAFGIGNHQLSPNAIDNLDISEHVRHILRTILTLAERPGLAELSRRLHTLGYGGRITTKTRRYSTTMSALRQRRADWTARHRELVSHSAAISDLGMMPDNDGHSTSDRDEKLTVSQHDTELVGDGVDGDEAESEGTEWESLSCGHPTDGERLLVLTAAYRHLQQRRIARNETKLVAMKQDW